MTTVCDGLAALNKVGIDKEYIRCSLKHVDMISMITELWSLSSFTPIQEHVYGHQDINDTSLTRQAKLNNEMDLMAKDIALEQIATDSTLWREPSTLGIGTIRCGGKLITSRTQQTLYTSILHDKLIS